MNTPAPVPTPGDPATSPATLPWYRSAVLQGILVAVIAQALLRLKTQFGIDLSQYAAFGLDPNSIATWVMDIISAGAVTYAAKARITSSVQPITLTKGPPK